MSQGDLEQPPKECTFWEAMFNHSSKMSQSMQSPASDHLQANQLY